MPVGEADNTQLIRYDYAVWHALEAMADECLHLAEALGGGSDFFNTPGQVLLGARLKGGRAWVFQFKVLQVQLDNFPAQVIREGEPEQVPAAAANKAYPALVAMMTPLPDLDVGRDIGQCHAFDCQQVSAFRQQPTLGL